MRAQVAERARAGLLPAQPPGQREVRVDQPVLEVRHAHVPQPAQAALVDHPAGQGGGRHPAVVETDHRHLAACVRLFGRAFHRSCFLDGVGQGLLAQDVLAGGQGREGDLGVAVAGGADVDEVDVVPLDEGTPVGLGGSPAVPVGRRPYGVPVPAADRGLHRVQRQVEDAARGAPALRVGGAHEGVAHHPHAQGWLACLLGPF